MQGPTKDSKITTVTIARPLCLQNGLFSLIAPALLCLPLLDTPKAWAQNLVCKKLLERMGKNISSDPEVNKILDRADQALVEHVNQIRSQLNPTQRFSFDKAIEQMNLFQAPRGRLFHGLARSTFFKEPELGLSYFARGHPLSRVTMAHELSHLSRMLPKHNRLERPFIELGAYRSNALLKEEALAFSDQYHFIRKAFSPEDLAILSQRLNSKVDPVLQARLHGAKVIDKNGVPIEPVSLYKRIKGRKVLARELVIHTESLRNKFFLQELEEALTKDLEQFLALKIHHRYLESQQHLDRVRHMAYAVLGISAGSIGGYFAYRQSANDVSRTDSAENIRD